MAAFLTILIVIVCLLLTLVVLVQNPKGGGLASGFSGANQFGGVKRTTDFLEKATWSLVIALFVLSVLSASLMQRGVVIDQQNESNIEQLLDEERPVGPAQNAPATAPILEDEPSEE
ncbi:MAG TPA: preprotein translocase subunit SecG [Flavobacteriales bacterium]|jgi:preprotein translocase subunit SecG|nr:preprotein translocase subunit SecG [Flavobacteriales bacterium]